MTDATLARDLCHAAHVALAAARRAVLDARHGPERRAAKRALQARWSEARAAFKIAAKLAPDAGIIVLRGSVIEFSTPTEMETTK